MLAMSTNKKEKKLKIIKLTVQDMAEIIKISIQAEIQIMQFRMRQSMGMEN